jgi:hypothetical protein
MVEAIADAIGDGISRLDLGIAEMPSDIKTSIFIGFPVSALPGVSVTVSSVEDFVQGQHIDSAHVWRCGRLLP